MAIICVHKPQLLWRPFKKTQN